MSVRPQTPAPPPTPATAPDTATPARDVARRLLQAESAAVAQLCDRIGPSFDQSVDLVTQCARKGGTLVVTGLGKSGLIGAKISGTLASVGVPSHWIHPTDAAHGDLGRFRPDDVCLALSYSGETEEVVGLAQALRQDGVDVISLTRGADDGTLSSLERLATAALTIGSVDDTLDLSPAPMCSTTAMAAMGDALALAASIQLNFTVDDFAKRHPGGTLGGLLRPVTTVLRSKIGVDFEPVADSMTVREALRLADSSGRRPGAMLLIDEGTGRLTGILTDADVRRLYVRDEAALDRPANDVMTRNPITLRDDALVRDAVHLVRERRLDELPVVDAAGRPVGVLDVQDLITMRVVDRR